MFAIVVRTRTGTAQWLRGCVSPNMLMQRCGCRMNLVFSELYVACAGLLTQALCLSLQSFKFFQARIEIEEHYLERFFGEQYRQYAERTKVWIPFIP